MLSEKAKDIVGIERRGIVGFGSCLRLVLFFLFVRRD